jgi:hypothetical protein
VSKKYSNEEMGVECVVKPETLLVHANARDNGEVIGTKGNQKTIPQVVIDTWVGWIAIDAELQRCPPITQTQQGALAGKPWTVDGRARRGRATTVMNMLTNKKVCHHSVLHLTRPTYRIAR